jgi:hypothetical protein
VVTPLRPPARPLDMPDARYVRPWRRGEFMVRVFQVCGEVAHAVSVVLLARALVAVTDVLVESAQRAERACPPWRAVRVLVRNRLLP